VTVLATQTPEYWGNSFALSADDREYLLTLFIEDELPRTLEELAQALVRYRVQHEEAALRRKQQAQGTLYQPKRTFEIGEQVVFPALDFAVGKVTGIRDGHNPEFGPFKVIEVELNGHGRREFAADFGYEHRLNADEALLTPTDSRLSPEELYQQYGPLLRENLAASLKADPDFVWIAGLWFPRGLIADVNIGHLNLAEAILDMNGGGPLPPEALLGDVGLPTEINRQLQIFSLNHALYRDERFDEVGPTGEVLWFLRRLEPPDALAQPRQLIYQPRPYDRSRLDAELVKIEQSIDDELSELPAPDEPPDELTFTLTYPHRRVGSIPLTPHIAQLFPTGRTHRIRFMFEDARTGNQWPGWVVREHQYAFGLDAWYEANEVPAGAYVQLQRGEQGVVIIDLQGHRQRREWVRVAAPKDGRLTFEMLKRALPCDFDEQMIVAIEDAASIDRLFDQVAERGAPLVELIEQLLPELAKLSPQGNVHVKTLYATINLIRRVPPGALFAALITQASFRAVGDGYWIAR
jgi:hypothetical protein